MPEFTPFVQACVEHLPEGWTVLPPEREGSSLWAARPPKPTVLFVGIVDAPIPSVDCRCRVAKRESYISYGWCDRQNPIDSSLGHYVKLMCEMAIEPIDPLTGLPNVVGEIAHA